MNRQDTSPPYLEVMDGARTDLDSPGVVPHLEIPHQPDIMPWWLRVDDATNQEKATLAGLKPETLMGTCRDAYSPVLWYVLGTTMWLSEHQRTALEELCFSDGRGYDGSLNLQSFIHPVIGAMQLLRVRGQQAMFRPSIRFYTPRPLFMIGDPDGSPSNVIRFDTFPSPRRAKS